jgi:hypothetical protein
MLKGNNGKSVWKSEGIVPTPPHDCLTAGY